MSQTRAERRRGVRGSERLENGAEPSPGSYPAGVGGWPVPAAPTGFLRAAARSLLGAASPPWRASAKRARLPWSRTIARACGHPRDVRVIYQSSRLTAWSVAVGVDAALALQVTGRHAHERFDRDLSALSVLASHGVTDVPVLLGVDVSRLLMVLRPVEEPTVDCGTSATGEAAAARLHLGALLVPPPGRVPRSVGPGVPEVDGLIRFIRSLGVDVDPRVVWELDRFVLQLTDTVADSVPLLSGDPCPDRSLTAVSEAQIVDLCAAGFDDPLVTLAHGRMGLPACWCRETRPGVEAAVEGAYRDLWACDARALATLGDGRLLSQDFAWVVYGDVPERDTGWEAVHDTSVATAADWRARSVSSRRLFVHRLAVVARLAAEEPSLRATAAVLADAHRRLQPSSEATPRPKWGSLHDDL